MLACMSIEISPAITIADDELEWRFIRSPGPGGQNVNKVATSVQLRFLLQNNTTIAAGPRQRLQRMAGQKLNTDGSILIVARSTRSQDQNRRDAAERLTEMIRAALIAPKTRKKTRPTRASQERRIESKKRRGATKHNRGSNSYD
jgi:ribosome-associated protein